MFFVDSNRYNKLPYSADLVYWFAANELFGKFSTLPSDSAAVSYASDLSGQSCNVSNATGAQQPLFKTGIANGYPGLLFDGSNDNLSFSGGKIGQNVTGVSIYAAFKTGSSFLGTNMNVLDCGVGTSAANRLRMYLAATSGALAMTTRRLDADAGTFTGAGGPAINTTYYACISHSYSTTTSTVYLNGSQIAQNTSAGTSGTSENTPNFVITLGGFGASESFNGHILEVFAYNTVHSTADRQSIDSYLKNKFGL